MLINISHAQTNGEGFVHFDIRVPKKFQNEDTATTHTVSDIKEQIEKKAETTKGSNYFAMNEKSRLSSFKHLATKSSSYENKNHVGQCALDDANLRTGEVADCKICGDKASKYCHYGGSSCQSCRAFFRRSVTKFFR